MDEVVIGSKIHKGGLSEDEMKSIVERAKGSKAPKDPASNAKIVGAQKKSFGSAISKALSEVKSPMTEISSKFDGKSVSIRISLSQGKDILVRSE